MSCRIRAVEHKKCAVGLAGTHPGLQDRIFPNYTRIENAHKVRKKTFGFLLCIEAVAILRGGHGPPRFLADLPACPPSFLLNFTFKFA